MIKYIFLIPVMTLIGAFGGFFFKKAISSSESIIKVVFKPLLYLGGFFYIAAAILNIIVLKKLDYVIVLPLTSITYIWTMIISYKFLKERITKKKIAGVLLIIFGAIIVTVT